MPRESEIEVDNDNVYSDVEESIAELTGSDESEGRSEVEASPDNTDDQQVSDRSIRDEKGRFAPKSKRNPGDVQADDNGAVAAEADPGRAKAPEGNRSPDPEGAEPDRVTLRAPQSWKPAIREKWATLPPDVKAEVVRLDRETHKVLSEKAEANKFREEFQSAIAPYEGMIRAEGSEPIRAVKNLLNTAMALRTAPPAHKAQLAAKMIVDYGVPAEAVFAHLQGAAPQMQTQQQGQEYRDPRVDEIIAMLEQGRTRKEREIEQQAILAREEMESNTKEFEFFGDVREQMADILDAYRLRGVVLTAKQAYDKALRMDDELWEVVQQRKARKAAENSNGSTQRAREAAGSIRSNRASGSRLDEKSSTLEDDVAESFAEVAARR